MATEPEKVAATALAVLRLTVHVRLVPVQAPAQPLKVDPVAGAAERITLLPVAKCCVQVFRGPVPVHFPAEVLTVPRPSTAIASVPAAGPPKVAVTLFAALIVRVQVVTTPVQAPPHLVNVAPETGVAVSVTLALAVRFALQAVAALPQLTPAPVTDPGPVTVTVSGTLEAAPPANVAVTLFALVIASVHVFTAPLQAPPHAVNVEPTAGVAVSATLAFAVAFAPHIVAPFPQLMPAPVTVPGPPTVTVSGRAAPVVNVAVTLFEPFIKIVQVGAAPPQAPLQPVNVDPVAAVAVSEIVLFSARLAVQTFALSPQLIAPSSPRTLPFPLTVTESGTTGANVALTDFAASMSTAHVEPVPEHAPPQPVKLKPSAACVVRTTVEFTACVAAQVVGQLIPPPLTVPLPATDADNKSPVELVQVALTEVSLDRSTVQATLVPLQAPPQPVKTLPAAPGFSTTVTVEPVSSVQAHADPTGSEPHAMLPPATLPAPVLVTDSVLVVAGGPVKLAVTSKTLPSTGMLHVLPTGAAGQPVHASKLQPLTSVAVRVVVPPAEKARLQVLAPFPQLMPAGLLVTVPLPMTCTVTVETASVRAPPLETPSTSGRSASATIEQALRANDR